MGQPVIALMWGVRASAAQPDLLKDGEWPWEDYTAAPIPHGLAPRDAYEGDVLGFKVACSVPDDDEDELVSYDSAVAVEDLASCFTARKIEAREKWEAFHAWVKTTCQKTLPEPQLWLTIDERA